MTVITYSSADDGYFILYSISKNHAWVRIPPVLSDGNSAGRAEKIYGPVVARSLYVIIFLDYYIRQWR